MTRTTDNRSKLVAVALRMPTLLAVATLGVFASGCGGSSGEGVDDVAGAETTTVSTESSSSSERDDALLAFAACMRENGVPDFADPQPSASGARLAFDPDAPGFKDASRTCQRLLPNGGTPTPNEQAKQLQKALDYADCMRRNGVPNFPDPKTSGGGIEWGELGRRVGIDPKSPQFKSAEEACKEVAPP